MDVKIAQGDIAMVASGEYEYITGIEEAVQRVRISALTVKGDFVYDRELGTDYRSLRAEELSVGQLDMLIKESCADIYGTCVQVLSFDKDRKTMMINVSYLNEGTTTEVDLSGIL